MKFPPLTQVRKWLVTVGNIVAVLVTLGVATGPVEKWLLTAEALLTSAGVYALRNASSTVAVPTVTVSGASDVVARSAPATTGNVTVVTAPKEGGFSDIGLLFLVGIFILALLTALKIFGVIH